MSGPSTFYRDNNVTVHHGDCLDILRQLPDNSVDAVVTDPPYGLGFMGKAWDDLPPGLPWAQECLRVLKPGGHLLAFGGTRTWHRLAVAVEDAGFEVRDSIAWLYGSGFPKSLDVSRAIDAHQKHGGSSSVQKRRAAMGGGYERSEVYGKFRTGDSTSMNTPASRAPEQVGERTDDAQAWQGWGTALKPAFEPIVVARKPLIGTVAGNVLTHGTGALNIDGCRVGTEERVNPMGVPGANTVRLAGGDGRDAENARAYADAARALPPNTVTGRWPANVVLDDTQAAALDQQSGTLTSGAIAAHHTRHTVGGNGSTHGAMAGVTGPVRAADSGGASRFFPTFRYQAKAPTAERPKGDDGTAHPTVKPLELMRWLVRLVTPPGGTVLDTFAGSGTTGEACVLEGFDVVLIEREADYLPLIVKRITRAHATTAARPPHAQDALDFGDGAA